MKTTITRAIKLGVALAFISLLAAFVLVSAHARPTFDDQFDAAGTYKAKCVACHGPTAAKHFDKTKADDQLMEAVMKGKKSEKPPNMPAYGEKGVTAEQAKSLVAYMKQL